MRGERGVRGVPLCACPEEGLRVKRVVAIDEKGGGRSAMVREMRSKRAAWLKKGRRHPVRREGCFGFGYVRHAHKGGKGRGFGGR